MRGLDKEHMFYIIKIEQDVIYGKRTGSAVVK